MFGIIDRFEENLAVVELEDGKIINIDKTKIPKEAKAGCVIRINDYITIDYEKTKFREKQIEKLTEDMWK